MKRIEMKDRLMTKKLKRTLLKNKGHKLPLLLILDTSGSMEHNDNIGKLNDGVKTFYDEVLSDEITREHLDLCVLSFGEAGVKVEQDFGSLASNQIPTFTAGGPSPLCTAIMTGLDLLEDQIDIYNGNGNVSHPPVMVIITDGEPTTEEYDENGYPILITQDSHDFQITKQKYNYFVKKMKLTSHCIWFGDEIQSTYFLEQFATRKDNVKKLKEAEMIKFFKVLGKSSSALSKAAPTSNGGEKSLLNTDDDVDLFLTV